jgi:hypothetical protein
MDVVTVPVYPPLLPRLDKENSQDDPLPSLRESAPKPAPPVGATVIEEIAEIVAVCEGEPEAVLQALVVADGEGEPEAVLQALVVTVGEKLPVTEALPPKFSE